MRTRLKIKKQYKRVKLCTALAIILVIALYIIVRGTMDFTRDVFNIVAEAPTHKVYAVEKSVIIVPTEHDEITSYIKEVFGKDSDKAFLLLSCENKALNPDAVNTAGNFPEDSEDVGIMQINTHWQGVQKKFLKNYKVNIQIGYQLFKENGNSFKLWTCGRRLSI